MYSVSVLLLLLHCFIFILVLLLCYVYRSSLYCNIPSDLCTLFLSCYYFYIVLSLYLYCCYVMHTDHHFTVIYLQICVPCVCFVITSTLFYFILVLLLCYLCRSSLYCSIPSDLCTLFFVLLSLLHCFIFILVLVLCCLSRSLLYYNIPSDVCTLCLSCYYSTLFYLYTCIVVMLCIPIISLL